MSQDILKRNNVKVSGRGTRPMLFAHGFGCEQNLWRFVAPAFEEDYRVVLFDYIGSGKSDLRAYDLERHSTRPSTAAGSSAPTSRGCSNSWSGATSAGPTSSRPP